jgi:mannitol/fructose-specific phosphotransferase system IIA component (Ntr-type)
MNLRDLLRPGLAAVDEQVEDWQGAIRAAGKLMVAEGGVEPRFVDAMIRVAKEFGPYIVIAPGIALPHARPEDGVINSTVAVVRLATAVNFGNEENDPVWLVVALAAKDKEGHIQGLADLATVLGEGENVEKIKQVGTAQEMLDIFWQKETPADQ